MRLRGIEFGPCWDAPGVRGWMGEGYWYHRLPFVRKWLKMEKSTFVSKTTTIPDRIPPKDGIMPIASTLPWAPLEPFPRCIWMNFSSKRTVNAVGLSGPGAATLLIHGLLDVRRDERPFQISFMSVALTPEERLDEFKKFVGYVCQCWPGTEFGVQINLSCPNAGLNPAHLVKEAIAMLDAAQPLVDLGIPIIVKVNLLAPIPTVKEISAHPNCDALCTTNAIPFGSLPEQIPWKQLFPRGSPVKRRNPNHGGGGYSGPELLPMVARYIRRAQDAGVTKPWNAGGGIRHARDVEYLVAKAGLMRGRDSIFFASAAMVCPKNVPGIIEAAHRFLG